ncbi:MAG: ATP-binding protein, partial [Bacteroidota bacterium]
SAVSRGADVARRLLSFSRHDEVHLVPMSLSEVTKELVKVLEHSIEKTIIIKAEVPTDLPPIEGDYGQLYQMLLNLSVNARDAIIDPSSGSQVGTITIGAGTVEGTSLRSRLHDATDDTYVHLTVTDTGIGMSDEVREKVFQPFFTTKPVGKGTGLGLSVVYTIVKGHRGFINLESEPGKGTTFHVYLPAITTKLHASTPTIDESTLGGNETILVVEDEEAVVSLLEEFLASYGYTVITASNGVEGIQMFVQHRDEIDVIITDLGLPRLSGYDMFMRIRELDPTARVILASGYLDAELKRSLLDAGARRFIAKPFSPMIVAKALREVLDEKDPAS